MVYLIIPGADGAPPVVQANPRQGAASKGGAIILVTTGNAAPTDAQISAAIANRDLKNAVSRIRAGLESIVAAQTPTDRAQLYVSLWPGIDVALGRGDIEAAHAAISGYPTTTDAEAALKTAALALFPA